jgi:hypothetical protein
VRVIVRPDLRVDRVERLDAARLAGLGLRGLLLDLDETLLPAAAALPSVSVRAWAAQLRGAGVRLAIVSNGRPRRVHEVARVLGVPSAALAGKPWLRAFQRGLAVLELPPDEVAMVGDQLFTDIAGARVLGLRTVLVPPLSSAGLPHTRLLRRVERRILEGRRRGGPVHR